MDLRTIEVALWPRTTFFCMIVSFEWIEEAPILLLGAVLFIAMAAASYSGYALRARQRRGAAPSEHYETKEGYVVSAVLGLLALLMGFTLSLALDRFDSRRVLVLQDANSIGTAYLRAQLLGEPHRQRLSRLLIEYLDNRVVLAKTPTNALLSKDDRLLTDLWAATAAAFDSIKTLDFSSTFVDSMNTVADLDRSRRAARQAHVPSVVFAALIVYLMVTAGLLGYVLSGPRGRLVPLFPLILLTLSLLLIIDIDRPTAGGILESQAPLEALQKSLKSTPARTYDRWRGEAPAR